MYKCDCAVLTPAWTRARRQIRLEFDFTRCAGCERRSLCWRSQLLKGSAAACRSGGFSGCRAVAGPHCLSHRCIRSEARVMDTIADHLAPLRDRLTIPRSVGGLVTRRTLVMSFVEVSSEFSSVQTARYAGRPRRRWASRRASACRHVVDLSNTRLT
jgi:hypothetical protein